MKVHATATYEIITWSDDEDEEHGREGGFTDPRNPWGGFRTEVPEGLCGDAFVAWRAENVETVTFDSMYEAAEFVNDFPGAVWDYMPDCDPSTIDNYRTSARMTVTLHLQDHDVGVFAIADSLAGRTTI